MFKFIKFLKFVKFVKEGGSVVYTRVEQSSLYENLKHRIGLKGNIRSQKHKDELNDLVYSEISIVASMNLDNFEISKLHQLFQSNYLIYNHYYYNIFLIYRVILVKS